MLLRSSHATRVCKAANGWLLPTNIPAVLPDLQYNYQIITRSRKSLGSCMLPIVEEDGALRGKSKEFNDNARAKVQEMTICSRSPRHSVLRDSASDCGKGSYRVTALCPVRPSPMHLQRRRQLERILCACKLTRRFEQVYWRYVSPWALNRGILAAQRLWFWSSCWMARTARHQCECI